MRDNVAKRAALTVCLMTLLFALRGVLEEATFPLLLIYPALYLLGDTILHSLLIHCPEVDVAVAIALLLLRMLLLLLDVGRGRGGMMRRDSMNSANIRIPWKTKKMIISDKIFLT